MRTVPAGSIPFILVEYSAGRGNAASLQTFEEAINSIEVLIYQQHRELVFVMRRLVKWRGCGSLTLRYDDLKLLEK